MDPVRALRQIAFYLERSGAPTYLVRVFRRAAQVVSELPARGLEARLGDGTLQKLPGVEPSTAEVVQQAANSPEPAYLTRLFGEAEQPEQTAMRRALRGDCHSHSTWSECTVRTRSPVLPIPWTASRRVDVAAM
jgi:putative hydrolase